MHIPSLSHSGSCSRGPYKGRDSVGHALCALPTSEQLRRAGAWRVPCPRWAVHLSHLLGPSRSGSRVCHVSPLGSWSQAATLLADVNHPGSQEDMVSNWEPAHSLVEDASLWGRDWSSPLPSGSGCHVSASLPLTERGGEACMQSASSSLVFAQSFVELEPFTGKLYIYIYIYIYVYIYMYFFFFPLWRFHSLGCCLTLASSDCPQAILAWSLPEDWGCSPLLPVQLPTRWLWMWVSRLLLCWQLQLGAFSVGWLVCFFVFFLVMFSSEIPKLPTDLPVTEFPTVWKILLRHNSFPRMGLHP